MTAKKHLQTLKYNSICEKKYKTFRIWNVCERRASLSFIQLCILKYGDLIKHLWV